MMFIRVLAERFGDRPGIVYFADCFRAAGKTNATLLIMFHEVGVSPGEELHSRLETACRQLNAQLIGSLSQGLGFSQKIAHFSRSILRTRGAGSRLSNALGEGRPICSQFRQSIGLLP